MAFKENLERFLIAVKGNSNFEIEEIQEFIIDAPQEELRASTKSFLALCHSLVDILVKTNRAVGGINFIMTAINRFQTHKYQLTSLHSELCLLCLESKCLNPALNLLDIDYNEIRKTGDTDYDAKYVALYYYYGGLISAAVKNFDRSSYYFEVVLTMPANLISSVMQETYKKFVVLNLLINKRLPDNLLPKYTSQCVLRQRKHIAPTYLKLALDYPSLDYNRIKSQIDSNSNVFTRDGNMGLIKQCLYQVHRRNIEKLTQTFLTLSLRDVANYVGLSSDKEAERFILNMIDDGEISATINQKDGMVVFSDAAKDYDTVPVFQKLQEDISITTNLINHLRKMEQTIQS